MSHIDWSKTCEPHTDHKCHNAYEINQLALLTVAKMLNTSRALAVLGSGVSRPYGYPDWQELKNDAINLAKIKLIKDATSTPLYSKLDSFKEHAEDLSVVMNSCSEAFESNQEFQIVFSKYFNETYPKKKITAQNLVLLKPYFKDVLNDPDFHSALDNPANKSIHKFKNIVSTNILMTTCTELCENNIYRNHLENKGFITTEIHSTFFPDLLSVYKNAIKDDPKFQKFLGKKFTDNKSLKAKDLSSDGIPNNYVLNRLISQIDHCILTLQANKNSVSFKSVFKKNIARHNKIDPDPDETSNNSDFDSSAGVLPILTDDLKISRFVTLNYDDSFIEHISKKALAPLKKDKEADQYTVICSNSIDEKARIVAPSENSFPEMMELASGDQRYAFDVLHLHGRTRLPESLILTEEDYQARYLRDTSDNIGYRNGLDYLFSANPILFIGVGLEEEDLLRPLRRMLSKKYRNANRPIVALMPAISNKCDPSDESAAIRELENKAVLRYEKYGILTLYFGASYEKKPSDSAAQPTLTKLELNKELFDTNNQDLKSDSINCHLQTKLKELSGIRKKTWRTWEKPLDKRRPLLESFPPNEQIFSRHMLNPGDVIDTGGSYDDCLFLKKNIKEIKRITTIKPKKRSLLKGYGKTEFNALNLLLTSPKGSGKGTFLHQLIRHQDDWSKDIRREYTSSFYLNTSVSDEVSSSVNFLLEWIENKIKLTQVTKNGTKNKRESTYSDSRINKLFSLLEEYSANSEKQRLLVVFGNCDRFISRISPVSETIKNLLQVFIHFNFIDTFVLSSGDWGKSYFTKFLGLKEIELNLNEIDSVIYRSKTENPIKQNNSINSINSILHNNTYSSFLLYHLHTEEIINDSDLEIMAHYAGTLSRAPGLDKILGLALTKLIAQNKGYGEILAHLALFGVPIDKEALFYCPKIVQAFSSENSNEEAIGRALNKLVMLKVVVPVFIGQNPSGNKYRCTLHRKLRRVLLVKLLSTSRDEGEFSFYSTSLFAAQPSDKTQLTEQSYDEHIKLVQSLTNQTADVSNDRKASCLRACMGLMHTIGSIGALSNIASKEQDKWGRRDIFGHHAARLRDIYDSARQLEENKPIEFSGAFYPHEAAALLNERGLFFLASGNLYDAATCLNQAEKLLTSNGQSSNPNRHWVQINCAIACIERGSIIRAGTLLAGIQTSAETTLNERKKRKKINCEHISENNFFYEFTILVVRGYRALIRHIYGQHKCALNEYTSILDTLQDLKNGRDRPRTIAIFSGHLGNLQRTMGDFQASKNTLQSALSAAQRGRCLDLVHHIRISQARTSLAQSMEVEEIEGVVNSAKHYAGRMGLESLYVDASTLNAQYALNIGNLEKALSNTLEASIISTKNGQKLKKLSSQLMLGEILLKKGDAQSCYRISVGIKSQAQHFGYQILLDKAERLILLCLPLVDHQY